MINQPITVVLSMHNAEQHLQRTVREVLDLAHSFVGTFSIVIVDNGSTDETYESACELSRVYPQIDVFRQSVQQGLPRVLEQVRGKCLGEAVLVHDGVADVDVDQLRSMLQSASADEQLLPQQAVADSTSNTSCASRRLGSLRSLQNTMERAHRPLAGFCWMRLGQPLVPRRCRELSPTTVVTSLPGFPMTSAVAPIA